MSTNRRDIVLGRDLKEAMPTTDITSATNGTEIDRQGFYAAKIIIKSDSLSAGTFTAKLQETNTSGSGFTDVAAVDVIVPGDQTASTVVFAATDDNLVKQIGYIGLKRFIRVVITPAGQSGANNLSAIAEQLSDFANAV